MSLILNLETSTHICSVSLSEGDKIIGWKEDAEGRNHATLLSVFIEDLLKENSVNPEALEAIAVSKGPGSYTGLRIGVSTAKGMAYALSKPLISVNTLKMMAAGYLQIHKELKSQKNLLLIPMIDARRMEVYSAIYNPSLDVVRNIEAEIIDENSFKNYTDKYQIIIFGDGADKCSSVLNHPSINIDVEFNISSKFMPEISRKKFEQKLFEDVAYFEPFYLKDFVATIPKKKFLP